MEADIYCHFRSSINTQEEIEEIEVMRKWEHRLSPLHCAPYNTKKSKLEQRAELSQGQKNHPPSPFPHCTQTLVGQGRANGTEKENRSQASILHNLSPLCRGK